MINFQANVSGEYRIVTYKDDGSIDYDSGYFDNLITNYGLDSFGGSTVESLFPKCFLTTENDWLIIPTNTTAFPTTTGILESTARTFTSDAKLTACDFIDASSEYKYTFTAPAAATTYTHVGVGKDATHLGSVSPTLTPLAVSGGKTFSVFWKLTIKYPSADKIITAMIGSVTHTCTLKPIGVSNLSAVSHGWRVLDYPFRIDETSNKCSGLVKMTPLKEVTDIFPATSDSLSIETNSITYSPYVNGTYTNIATLVWSTNGNGTFNVIHFRTAFGKFQIEFVPDFTKLSVDQFSIMVKIIWNRASSADCLMTPTITYSTDEVTGEVVEEIVEIPTPSPDTGVSTPAPIITDTDSTKDKPTLIKVDQYVTGKIDNSVDEDWFYFKAIKGKSYKITKVGTLTYYKTNKSTVISMPIPSSSVLTDTFFYIKATGAVNSTYSFTVSEVIPAPIEDTDTAGNSTDDPYRLTLNVPVTKTILNTKDVDYFVFTATFGDTYKIVNVSGSATMIVVDKNDKVLESSGTFHPDDIAIIDDYSQDYYIKVSGTVGSYTLRVDLVSDNDFNHAIPMPTREYTPMYAIYSAYDVDYHSFDGVAGETVGLQNIGGDFFADFYNEDKVFVGRTIGISSAAATDENSHITLKKTGKHYIKISHTGRTMYSLMLVRGGDSVFKLAERTSTTTVNNTMQSKGYAWWSFPVSAGKTYTVDLIGSGFTKTCYRYDKTNTVSSPYTSTEDYDIIFVKVTGSPSNTYQLYLTIS